MIGNVGFNNNMMFASAMFGQPQMFGGAQNAGGFGSIGGFGNLMPQQSAAFMVQARSAAEDLRNTLTNLIGRNAETWQPTQAASYDTDVLTIGRVNAANVRNADPIRVTVEQIALAQRNEGEAFQRTQNAVDAGFTLGQNRFELEVGGRLTSIAFNVNAGDNVQTVQNRMAAAVNNANAGVRASVTVADGQSTLALESVATGITREGQNNFNLRDVTGNAVVAAGLDLITQEAQNAQFRIGTRMSNGEWLAGSLRETRTNSVDIGNGVTAQLTGAGVSTVSFTQDTVGMQNAARDMVNNFNRLLDAAMDNEGDRRTNNLINQMQNLMRTHSVALERIGITETSNGFLTINERTMREAAENGRLERFFTGNGNQDSFGFANRLSRIANDVARAPERFTSGASIGNGFENAAFRGNVFVNQRMNHFMGMGMLLNMMI